MIFGPGDVKVAHSADEHVPLDEVEACARVLAAWVVRGADRRPRRAEAPPRRARLERRPTGQDERQRDRDQRRAEQARAANPAAARITPEPRLAAAAELQISASVEALEPGPLDERQARRQQRGPAT